MLVLLLVFGAGMLAVGVMLFRAALLFPRGILRLGWKRALYAYKFSVVLAVVLTVYEAGNLTGFSWERMRYVSDDEFIQNAIRYAYPRIYDDVAALRVDYPGFEPRVRYWGSWNPFGDNDLISKLLGFTRYQVKLPDVQVSLDASGKAQSSSGCETDPCWAISPANPIFGIVGTVQLDDEDYPIATDFSLGWGKATGGEMFQLGHCFSAYRAGEPEALIIRSAGTNALKIRPQYGYYLVVARLKPGSSAPGAEGGTYSRLRISKQEFLKWKSCSDAARQDWPNVGGWGWKR